jgi:hypothetical protein
MKRIAYGFVISLVLFGSSPALAVSPVSKTENKLSANACSSSSINPNAECSKEQIVAVIETEKIARASYAQQYISIVNSVEGVCLYSSRSEEVRRIESGNTASGPKVRSATYCSNEAKTWRLYDKDHAGYETLKANYEQLTAAANAATPKWAGCSNCYDIYLSYISQWIDLYNVRVQQYFVSLKALGDSYNSSKQIIDRFEAAYLTVTATTIPHKRGDCPVDPNSSSSQIFKNGKTYIGLGGVRLLCKNGVIVKKGKVPLEAKFLTCAVFNSKSDEGCYVKDSWGYLTWLFNLPQKTPVGKVVSNGSYYTKNGYCKVALYKNFAYTDSCG